MDYLKTNLRWNSYPLNFIDSCKKLFFNNYYTPKAFVQNVPKWDVYVKLTSLESTSSQIRKKLKQFLKANSVLVILKSFLCHIWESNVFHVQEKVT